MDHSGKYVDRDLYLIVIDKDGMRVVHGQNPKLVGKRYFDAVDVNDKAYGKEVSRSLPVPARAGCRSRSRTRSRGRFCPRRPTSRRLGTSPTSPVSTSADGGSREQPNMRLLRGAAVVPRSAAVGEGAHRSRGVPAGSPGGRSPRRFGSARPGPKARLADVANNALPTAAASAQLLDAVDTIQVTAMRARVWQQAGVRKPRLTGWSRTSGGS